MLLTRVRFPSLAPGLLAQLVRALPSHGRGRWSESSTAHHLNDIQKTAMLFAVFLFFQIPTDRRLLRHAPREASNLDSTSPYFYAIL